jgi:E3 ubiquitin-protein ligase UBR4
MTLTLGGSVQDHLAFHPQLEMGNFIIKAVWLPASKRDAIELIKNVKQ